MFCLLQNGAQHTPNAIGHCIVWFVFDMQISLILKIQSLSLLWSLCENFRPLAEAKCQAVWKMIVITRGFSFNLTIFSVSWHCVFPHIGYSDSKFRLDIFYSTKKHVPVYPSNMYTHSIVNRNCMYIHLHIWFLFSSFVLKITRSIKNVYKSEGFHFQIMGYFDDRL